MNPRRTPRRVPGGCAVTVREGVMCGGLVAVLGLVLFVLVVSRHPVPWLFVLFLASVVLALLPAGGER